MKIEKPIMIPKHHLDHIATRLECQPDTVLNMLQNRFGLCVDFTADHVQITEYVGSIPSSQSELEQLCTAVLVLCDYATSGQMIFLDPEEFRPFRWTVIQPGEVENQPGFVTYTPYEVGTLTFRLMKLKLKMELAQGDGNQYWYPGKVEYHTLRRLGQPKLGFTGIKIGSRSVQRGVMEYQVIIFQMENMNFMLHLIAFRHDKDSRYPCEIHNVEVHTTETRAVYDITQQVKNTAYNSWVHCVEEILCTAMSYREMEVVEVE